jgi:site-specific recombinase XerD
MIIPSQPNLFLSANNLIDQARMHILAGINKNIHPHTLRHSFATELVKGGANLVVVKDMMGHQSILSTEIYTHLDIQHLRETIMLYHPHYNKSRCKD